MSSLSGASSVPGRLEDDLYRNHRPSLLHLCLQVALFRFQVILGVCFELEGPL
jgi:hypothetical protein